MKRLPLWLVAWIRRESVKWVSHGKMVHVMPWIPHPSRETGGEARGFVKLIIFLQRFSMPSLSCKIPSFLLIFSLYLEEI